MLDVIAILQQGNKNKRTNAWSKMSAGTNAKLLEEEKNVKFYSDVKIV